MTTGMLTITHPREVAITPPLGFPITLQPPFGIIHPLRRERHRLAGTILGTMPLPRTEMPGTTLERLLRLLHPENMRPHPLITSVQALLSRERTLMSS